MGAEFPILDVSGWEEQQDETLGSKDKVWLRSPEPHNWLFKVPRPGSGEHWAEKIAAGVAALLGVPTARVELARRESVIGSISRSFARPRRPRSRSLIAGNELLRGLDESYEGSKKRPRKHTVELVFRYLRLPKSILVPEGFAPEPGLMTAVDVFVGYLLLDALIGNTDRHHENWGILVAPAGSEEHDVWLAPTFDHASSLGRELDDSKRDDRVKENNPMRTVEGYCSRARSSLFKPALAGGTRHSPRSAFLAAARERPAAADAWCSRLRAVDPADLHACVHGVPGSVISDTAKRFAARMLECNRDFLLGSSTP